MVLMFNCTQMIFPDEMPEILVRYWSNFGLWSLYNYNEHWGCVWFLHFAFHLCEISGVLAFEFMLRLVLLSYCTDKTWGTTFVHVFPVERSKQIMVI